MSGKWIETLVAGVMGTLIVVVAVLLSGLLLGFPLKWCWNYVIPHITNGAVSEIGFWHAIAMWVLFSMLLKSSTSSAKRR
jgi:hypothetical protein